MVRSTDRNAQEIAKDDKKEELFHRGLLLEHHERRLVKGHAEEELPNFLKNPTRPSIFG